MTPREIESLQPLLQGLARHSPPPLPGAFQANVWREIRRLRSPEPAPPHAGWNWLFPPVIKWPAAAASMALALMIGAGMGWHHAANQFPGPLADWSVFSAQAPGLPSTLLESIQ